jgi:hypothetical protein
LRVVRLEVSMYNVNNYSTSKNLASVLHKMRILRKLTITEMFLAFVDVELTCTGHTVKTLNVYLVRV